MRKVIFTFLMGILAFGAVNAQEEVVVFDPSDYELGPLNGSDAMTIVEIDGAKYLQVELAGWGSNLQVSQTALDLKTEIVTTIKYAQGTQTVADGLTLDNITAGVNLQDSENTWDYDWGEGTAQNGPSKKPAPAEFTVIKAGFTVTTQENVDNIQFYGQEDQNWQAVAGDTLWVGKIETKAVSVNENKVEAVSVYPNPATSELNIDMTNAVSAEVYNIVGAKVISTNVNGLNTIDVSNLSMGVYILKVTDVDNKTYVAKFSKK